MSGAFHWVRVRLFCYSTENVQKLEEVMETITGTSEFVRDYTEGHHGNSIMIFDCELTKDAQTRKLFTNLGKEVLDDIRPDLEEKIDDDCVFYARLDKQKAVQGEFVTGHRGDVISITGKLVSHPAKKAVAVRNMGSFLDSL
jgi:Predicted exosome subunit